MAEGRNGEKRRPARRRARFAAVIVVSLAASRAARAQQTIFNVPSTEVLDTHQTYLELDVLGVYHAPGSARLSTRSAYGLGSGLEAGLNLDGIRAPGRSEPVLQPTIKWSPWRADHLALAVGAIGQFFVRGSRDGEPGILGYAEASWEAPTNTTITAGGYWASSGYAADDPQAGPLLAVEQEVVEHVKLVADWVGGENDLGYVTPGVSVELDPWTLQLGYSIRNGDSRGNGILFQVQAKF